MLKVDFKKSTVLTYLIIVTPLLSVLLFHFVISTQNNTIMQVDEQNSTYAHQALSNFKLFMKQAVDDSSDLGRLSDTAIQRLEKVKEQLIELQASAKLDDIEELITGVDNILIKTSLDPSLNMLMTQITTAQKLNSALNNLTTQIDERIQNNRHVFTRTAQQQMMLVYIVLALTVIAAMLYFYLKSRRIAKVNS